MGITHGQTRHRDHCIEVSQKLQPREITIEQQLNVIRSKRSQLAMVFLRAGYCHGPYHATSYTTIFELYHLIIKGQLVVARW